MKKIDIAQQPILSFKRTLQIALTGVRYRLFRAMVTVAVIALAMAFLMNILCESLIKKEVAQVSRQEIFNIHLADQWIAKLSNPQSPADIVSDLGEIRPGESLYQELSAFSNCDAPQFKTLVALAQTANLYLDFFNKIDYGRLRILVGSHHGLEIFTALHDPITFKAFAVNLAALRTLRMPNDIKSFQAFLKMWPQLESRLKTIYDNQKLAVNDIKNVLGNKSVASALLDIKGQFGDELKAVGFVVAPEIKAELVLQVRRTQEMQFINLSVKMDGIKKPVAARLNILPIKVKVEMLWDIIENLSGAQWYLDLIEQNPSLNFDLSAKNTVALAKFRKHSRLLKKAELITLGAGQGGLLGIGKRMTWLALVSMLVCIVGITNAMLMSVTERFREIATLKCLGALDGFIMSVFLIESCIMGLVGGIIGAFAGLVLCSLRMLFVFKGLLLSSFPLTSLFWAVLISVAVGIIISAVAAVYPSFRAAQLAPMEAMRIE